MDISRFEPDISHTNRGMSYGCSASNKCPLLLHSAPAYLDWGEKLEPVMKVYLRLPIRHHGGGVHAFPHASHAHLLTLPMIPWCRSHMIALVVSPSLVP